MRSDIGDVGHPNCVSCIDLKLSIQRIICVIGSQSPPLSWIPADTGDAPRVDQPAGAYVNKFRCLPISTKIKLALMATL
jgi:hypothetical protein